MIGRQPMSSEPKTSHPAEAPRRDPQPLILVGLLGGLAIGLLWFVDPRQVALPLCSFHTVTGLYCPGCGATRATHALLHGELLCALRYNALWILALPLAVYALASETCRLARGRPLPWDLVENRWFLVGAITVAVLFGLLRNVPVYPFVLLAPPG
jgi:hypothetical protein